MTANTGRTNERWTDILIDNTSGTLTSLKDHLKSINGYGLKFTEADVTGVGNAIKNITLGRPEAPLSITWQKDTVVYAHLIALIGRETPLSLDIRQGIGHVWESGEPTFGITSSATSGYVMTSFIEATDEYQTTWNVRGGTAPDFATTAHT